MQFMPYINTFRRGMFALMHACFPPDAIDRAADSLSFDQIVRIMRPKLLEVPRGAVALFDYHDPTIRSLIYAMKYRGRRSVANVFGECAAEYLRSEIGAEQWRIVPVPLSPQKKRSRGYNQSALIAESIVRHLDGFSITVSDALVRTRDTESQTKQKSKKARIENMRGAFAVPDAKRVHGHHILLVDDVATTGATLSDAKRALSEAGASEIRILAIASGQQFA